MTTTPNILFIITDQQRADHTGFMGNKVVRTPNLDSLADRSLVFDNTWVSNPVCMPNRSTIMTGRMPTAHGVIFNDRSLDWGVNTFVRQFRAAGYKTGLLGKSHLQHGMSRFSGLPYRGQPSGILPFKEGWDEVEHEEHYLNGLPEDPEDFYGFSHIELAINHGARAAGHYLQWALERGAELDDMIPSDKSRAAATQRSEHWQQIFKPGYDESLHSTSFVTDRTLAFIEDSHKAASPWLAWCSFPDPHHPITPPGQWFDRHNPEDMVLPESRHDTLEDAPEHLRFMRGRHPKEQRNAVDPCGYGDDDLLRQAIAGTYGMIEMIDDGIGQILRKLDTLGIADNTIVVFTSDHGDMMGDHGLLLKGIMHYRGTLQVPLTISAPGKVTGRTNSLASSIDLGPTLMSLCGIKGYDGIQGKNLAPVLEDPKASVRDHVLIEDDMPTIIQKLSPIPARTRTIVTEEWRYTKNSKGEEQLFNLIDDHDEMQNRQQSDEKARAQLADKMLDAMMWADDSARGAPAEEPMAGD